MSEEKKKDSGNKNTADQPSIYQGWSKEEIEKNERKIDAHHYITQQYLQADGKTKELIENVINKFTKKSRGFDMRGKLMTIDKYSRGVNIFKVKKEIDKILVECFISFFFFFVSFCICFVFCVFVKG